MSINPLSVIVSMTEDLMALGDMKTRKIQGRYAFRNPQTVHI